MKESREFENKEQTARKRLENSKTRRKLFEREEGIGEQGANRSKETREFENKAHSKETRQFENKGQTARKRVEN